MTIPFLICCSNYSQFKVMIPDPKLLFPDNCILHGHPDISTMMNLEQYGFDHSRRCQPKIVFLFFCFLTLIPLGGGFLGPPLDIFREKSGTRKARATNFSDFFISSLAQLLRPNSRRPGMRFRRYAHLKKIRRDKYESKT